MAFLNWNSISHAIYKPISQLRKILIKPYKCHAFTLLQLPIILYVKLLILSFLNLEVLITCQRSVYNVLLLIDTTHGHASESTANSLDVLWTLAQFLHCHGDLELDSVGVSTKIILVESRGRQRKKSRIPRGEIN